jgi:hypothetical protein
VPEVTTLPRADMKIYTNDFHDNEDAGYTLLIYDTVQSKNQRLGEYTA